MLVGLWFDVVSVDQKYRLTLLFDARERISFSRIIQKVAVSDFDRLEPFLTVFQPVSSRFGKLLGFAITSQGVNRPKIERKGL